MTLTYRWLGVAGLEIRLDDFALLIDPFFTRPGRWAVLTGGRVPSDEILSARHAPEAGAVLVTHPHYDHLMDVPAILRRTAALAYGSPFTARILALHGIPAGQTRIIAPGDTFTAVPFSVAVLPARHTPLPFGRLYHDHLPALRPAAERPLRLSDYRMDACFGFRVRAGRTTLAVGSINAPADVLFLSPYHPPETLAALLRDARPRLVIPIHWDDFTRPLSAPLRPMIITPAQGLRPRFPPLGRVDLAAFERAVRAVLPGAQVRVPALLEREAV